MLHSDLAVCIQDFLTQFQASLSAPTGGGSPQGGAPPQAQGGSATDVGGTIPIFVGDYVVNSATPKASESCLNVTLEPAFVLTVSRAQATPNGSGTSRTFTVPTDLGSNPRPQTIVLLRENGDVVADDRASLERVMSDWDEGHAWAERITALPNRSQLAVQLTQVTQVPQGLPTTDPEELKAVLNHFFTYKVDGAYYAKYTTPPPQGQYPTHLSQDYVRECFVETKLQQGRMYVYAVLPESVWLGQGGRAGYYREMVYRLDDQEQGSTPRYSMSLLHTAALYLDPNAQATPDNPKEQIVVFFASDGTSLKVADSGRRALSPRAASLVQTARTSVAALGAAIKSEEVPIYGTEAAPYMVLMGRVTVDFPRTPVPQEIDVSGEGPIRAFRCPLDQVVALAEREDVHDLEPADIGRIAMDQAATATHLGDFFTHLTVTNAQGGHNVLVGIVDTGVDGTHQAFIRTLADGTPQSRIVAAWDQSYTGPDVANPDRTQSPLGRRGAAAADVQNAYQGMNYGREFERSRGENVQQNFDSNGHGTHVAGIAAGLPVTVPAGTPWPGGAGSVWPGGVAQAAELIVVQSTGGLSTSVYDGIRYCFRKATELGKPCVVNVSLRTHRHAHDGTDSLSTGVNSLVTQFTPAAFDPNFQWQEQQEFLPGRIVCAAAGNERREQIHWMAEISPRETVSTRFTPGSEADGLTFWVYGKDGADANLCVQVASGRGRNLVRTANVFPQPTHAPVATPFAALGIGVDVHNGPVRPANGHRNIEVIWHENTPGALTGSPEWRISFTNRGRSKVFIDGWTIFHLGPQFSGTGIHESRKIGSPAAAVGAIGVASFVSRHSPGSSAVGQLAASSSPGPLRATRGRQGITVTAPGELIFSAAVGTTNDVRPDGGTSMASPFVAGVVACMLGKDPNLSHSQVRDRLRVACDPPNNQADDWGAGKLNAARIQV